MIRALQLLLGLAAMGGGGFLLWYRNKSAEGVFDLSNSETLWIVVAGLVLALFGLLLFLMGISPRARISKINEPYPDGPAAADSMDEAAVAAGAIGATAAVAGAAMHDARAEDVPAEPLTLDTPHASEPVQETIEAPVAEPAPEPEVEQQIAPEPQPVLEQDARPDFGPQGEFSADAPLVEDVQDTSADDLVVDAPSTQDVIEDTSQTEPVIEEEAPPEPVQEENQDATPIAFAPVEQTEHSQETSQEDTADTSPEETQAEVEPVTEEPIQETVVEPVEEISGAHIDQDDHTETEQQQDDTVVGVAPVEDGSPAPAEEPQEDVQSREDTLQPDIVPLVAVTTDESEDDNADDEEADLELMAAAAAEDFMDEDEADDDAETAPEQPPAPVEETQAAPEQSQPTEEIAPEPIARADAEPDQPVIEPVQETAPEPEPVVVQIAEEPPIAPEPAPEPASNIAPEATVAAMSVAHLAQEAMSPPEQTPAAAATEEPAQSFADPSATTFPRLQPIKDALEAGRLDDADALLADIRRDLVTEGDEHTPELAELTGLAGDHAAASGRPGGAKWLYRLAMQRFQEADAEDTTAAKFIEAKLEAM